MTKTDKIKLIILIFIIAILALLKVNVCAVNATDIYNRTDHRPKDIIEYENKEADELSELTSELFEQIAAENEFKIAYLNNSTHVNDNDVKILGNIIYNESRGESKLVWSCVAWTVMNHCDNDNKSIEYEANFPNRFAYKPGMKLKAEKAKELLQECEDIARDVIIRHMCEQDGIKEVGRTLPNDYFSYWGDGKTTHFRKQIKMYDYWDFSLGNPYNI